MDCGVEDDVVATPGSAQHSSLCLLSYALGGKFEGVSAAARKAKQRNVISAGLSRKCERLDVAAHWSRHATMEKANGFLHEVATELGISDGSLVYRAAPPDVLTEPAGEALGGASLLSTSAQFDLVDAPPKPTDTVSSPSSMNPDAVGFAPADAEGLLAKIARLEKAIDDQADTLKRPGRSLSEGLLADMDLVIQKSCQTLSLAAAHSAVKELRAVREVITQDVLGQLQASVSRSSSTAGGCEVSASVDVDVETRADVTSADGAEDVVMDCRWVRVLMRPLNCTIPPTTVERRPGLVRGLRAGR